MKEVSTSTSWQSNTPLLHTGNVYFVSETENGKQDTCSLEELMAAFFFLFFFFRKHSLLGVMYFISKRKALDSGSVFGNPWTRAF